MGRCFPANTPPTSVVPRPAISPAASFPPGASTSSTPRLFLPSRNSICVLHARKPIDELVMCRPMGSCEGREMVRREMLFKGEFAERGSRKMEKPAQQMMRESSTCRYRRITKATTYALPLSKKLVICILHARRYVGSSA